MEEEETRRLGQKQEAEKFSVKKEEDTMFI
jgi:hypothetical protein